MQLSQRGFVGLELVKLNTNHIYRASTFKVTQMLGQNQIGAEDRLFDALGEIFELEPNSALDISTRAACQIAAFVADIGAVSKQADLLDIAISRIAELRRELEVLDRQLVEFKKLKSSRTVH